MFKKIIFLFFYFFSLQVFAQEDVDLLEEDVESVEGEHIERLQRKSIKNITDLVYLTPFSDISVIQRRFMPKTGRLSISTSAVFILSSEFFLNTGLEMHLSYHFLEKHSMELLAYYTIGYKRQAFQDLKNIGVDVKLGANVSVPEVFAGITYKWMPIYGKIAFFNRKILAFDTFFSFGAGLSRMLSRVWEPTGLLGVGQVFAVTRDFGLRWDLRLHIPVETKHPSYPYHWSVHSVFTLGFIYYYPSMRSR